jgi:hypothetical protein
MRRARLGNPTGKFKGIALKIRMTDDVILLVVMPHHDQIGAHAAPVFFYGVGQRECLHANPPKKLTGAALHRA